MKKLAFRLVFIQSLIFSSFLNSCKSPVSPDTDNGNGVEKVQVFANVSVIGTFSKTNIPGAMSMVV
ncbi:MAG: hypothetical protein V3R45_08475 [Candidatus Aminicenantaceae bacterium]